MISARALAKFVSLFCIVISLTPALGQAPAKDALSPPAFRRIFIPESEINNREWTGRYLAIDNRELQALLQTAADGARGVPGVRRARVETANYSLRLVAEDLLRGSVVFQFSSAGETPVLLPLDLASVAIESAAWLGEPARPAVFGADPEGRLHLLVEGTRLECQIAQRGERTASGAVRFPLELARSPMTNLVLDVPPGQEVVTDHGIVAQSSKGADGTNRWNVNLGGHQRDTLRIVPADAARQRRPLTLVRQSQSYEFTARGINVGTQLRLDVHGEPLARATIELDPSLRLVAARYGETAVPWSATTDPASGQQQVLLEFPQPVEGTGRVLQLSAVAPLTTGRPFRLPQLQPRDIAWQEGTIELLIPNSLVLEQLTTDGGRQSRVTPLPRTGESIEIQCYRQDASISVLVNAPRERLAVASGTLVDIGAEETHARCALDIKVRAGERREVKLPVHGPWTIDGVDSLHATGPLKWDLEESPAAPPQLRITLNGPSQVLVRAVRPSSAANQLPAAELQPLDLSAYENNPRLISVAAADALDVRVSGPAEFKGREAAGLAAAELQLFSQLPAAPVFAEDDSFAQSSVTIARRKPNYGATIDIDAAVEGNTLRETYTIQCTPDTARVERLLVHFSQAREAPLAWNLAGGNSGRFSARRLSAGEQATASIPAGGEAWELTLNLARSGPFELRAQRSVPFTSEMPLALVSVHDAATQRGTLAIRAVGETSLGIVNPRLMSVPAELLAPDRCQTARATFHYQPSGDELGPESAIRIDPAPPKQAETGAWCWLRRLESRLASGGIGMHRATLCLQTAGRKQVRLNLPSGAKLLSATVDGKTVAQDAKVANALEHSIHLPPGASHVTLSIQYTTPAMLSSLVTHQTAPFPALDVPILHSEWSVWLPPGYELTDIGGCTSGDVIAAPTWSQRVFGALGRGRANHIFNPMVAADWREILAAGAENRPLADARKMLENLSALLGEYAAGEALTWGQLLSLLSDLEAAGGRVLLVDSEPLAQLGATPRAQVAWHAAGTPRAADLLREKGLVVVVAPGVALVTSAAGAASLRNQLAPANGPIHVVAGEALAERMQVASSGNQPWRFETVGLWRALAAAPADWTWPEPVADAGDESLGWSRYRLACSAAETPRVRIVHSATMQSLAWATFLGFVALGLWKLTGKTWIVLAATALAAAAALVAPIAYVPLLSAAVLAGMFCFAVRLIAPPLPPRTGNDRSSGSKKSRSGALPRLAMILAAVAAASTAHAQPEPALAPLAPQRAPSVHRVYVPVDNDQEPSGKCYVPETFYEQLLRLAAKASGQPKDWLVTRGVYQGTLSRDPVMSRIGLAELKARFDFRVFQGRASVRLPLVRDAWGDAILAARLDGRAIPVEWNPTGSELVLGLLPAGQYRLELDLRPQPPRENASAGIDLPIPRLPNATLELAVPQDAPAVEVRGARGLTNLDKQAGKLIAHLGAVDRLSVGWGAEGTGSGAPNLEVEELVWVKVRPGTTVLDARFKYRVLSGRVRQLQLVTDPRLSLLTSPNSPAGITAHTIPGDPQRIDLDLGRDVSGEVVVDLSFLLTGASGVGNLRLPRLESAAARASRRWLAVSVDPALQPKVQAGEDSRSLEINDFVAAWGNSSDKPQAVYAIPRGEPIWVLSTRPSEPLTSVEQSLAVSLGTGSSLVRFDATLAISGGVLVQLELEVPPAMVVEDISLLEENVQRVARWSADAGRVSVFLTTPLDGRQQLAVRGRWTPSDPAAFQTPQLRVLAADIRKNLLRVYRQPAVLAELNAAPKAVAADLSTIEPQAALGSLCGAYTLEDATAAVQVKLAPNEPDIRAQALVFVEPDGDRWMAALEYHCEVRSGLADALLFDIPAQWSEPFEVVPAMAASVVSIPGEQRRRLLLTPARPLAGKHQVRVRARVAASPGDRLSAPDIVPLRVRELERFVALPRQLENRQQIIWDTLGLVSAKLPGEFAALAGPLQSAAVYQVSGEHFQASLKAVQHYRALPRVGLVDIHVAWQPDGSYEGVAAFDLEPGGSTHCVLELPAGCRLVHAAAGQLPALASELGQGRWRLSLGPQQLPQRVEILYTGATSVSGTNLRFAAPRLVDLDVAQTLWTIYAPAECGPAEPRQSPWRINAPEQDLIRLERIAHFVDLPPEVVGEHLPEEIARWYEIWRKRYSAARAALGWELIAERRDSAQTEESLTARRLDEQLRAVDARLGAGRGDTAEAAVGDNALRFASFARFGRSRASFVNRGAPAPLEVKYAQPAARPLAWRIVAGLALLVAGAACAWWSRSRSLPTFSAGVVIAGLGFLGWLLLAPSFLGLVIGLAATCASIWARRQAKSGHSAATLPGRPEVA